MPRVLSLSSAPLLLVPVMSAMIAAPAADRGIIGPRSLGMGGTGVAIPTDVYSQYHNPAGLGFMLRRTEAEVGPTPEAEPVRAVSRYDNHRVGDKTWGLGVDVQAGVQFFGDLGEILTNLEDIDFDAISEAQTLTASQAQQVLELIGNVSALDTDSMALALDANGGAGARIGHLAIGARVWFDGFARVNEIDMTNLGLQTPGELANSVNNNAAEIIGSAPSAYLIRSLSPAQQTTLADQGFTVDGIKAVDSVLAPLANSGLLSEAELQEALDTISNALSGDGSIDDNTTSVAIRGLQVTEIPVSYGYAFDDRLAIGITAKLMLGRVFGTNVLVFDDPDFSEIEDQATEDYEDSISFGIDLAVLYRLPNLQAGLIARNINQPSFDGYVNQDGVEIGEQKIDPTLTLGLAWIPIPTFTLAVDAELWERNDVTGFRDIQEIRVGLEWDVLRFLALRAGVYDNLAEADEEPVVSAGVGLNFWLMRIDLAGAIGLDTISYDDEEYPTSGRVALGLQMDF